MSALDPETGEPIAQSRLPFLGKVNELQRNSITRLRQTLRWSHYTNITVRKDGQDYHFEADWLRDALDILCGKLEG